MERPKNLWTIMLAGRNGARLLSFVLRLFGRERPKQYCAFIGTRTMFQHTLERANRLSLPEHQAIVVAKSHMDRGWVGWEHAPEES
jgi:mannose-1-phosphate guanylyltransferase